MKKPIGVKILNQYIKRELSVDPILNNIYVIGEVTNLKKNRYMYFDLKEDDDLINCVCFNQILKDLENGSKVVLTGNLTTYSKASRYQINVSKIEIIGEGESFSKLNKLKDKLKSLGYFDDWRKKTIPNLPIKIGLITSDKSAAIRDFLSILEKNYPLAEIKLYSTRVQGQQAINEIISGIKKLDTMDLDLLVLTRGGGSNEDLSLFNDENLATEIFKANTPIISAIGHEVDFTISDLVSDLRVSTPTKAAQYICQKYEQYFHEISNRKDYIDSAFLSIINKKSSELETIRSRIISRSPKHILESHINRVETIHSKLDKLMIMRIGDIDSKINNYRQGINESFNKHINKNLMLVKSLDMEFVDLNNLIVDENYVLYNDKSKYTIKILEKHDE